jgi:trehalose utilization protein
MAELKLTIYNEFIHEQKDDFTKKLYPKGMHEAIAEFMRKEQKFDVKTATLEMEEHGLTEKVLNSTDVLMWWGHIAHDKVEDKVVDRVQRHVLNGMGLIVMHSGHGSRIFQRLMGTSCGLTWREAGERERLWVVNPNHPITQGIGAYIELPNTEMYGERFDIPDPDELLFISWFEGGEVFRSGATWHRGKGRIFYFRPGHETYPIFYNKDVLKVLANGIRWAKFSGNTETKGIGDCPNIKQSIEPLSKKNID